MGKLYHYGIRVNVHKIFSSVLSNKLQFVALNNPKSDKLLNDWSVPQGSVLGSLSLTLYINDIYAVTQHTSRLYTDDICLIFHHKNLYCLNLKVN